MADLTVTAAQVSPVNETQYEGRAYMAATAITAGQAVYVTSAGKINLARANAVGTARFVGIALRTVGAGQVVNVIQRGSVAGFDLSGMAYGATVYLSDATAGALGDTVNSGTGNVVTPVGQVLPMSDSDYTKVLWVAASHTFVPVAL